MTRALEGKVAVITGAAGAIVARRLATCLHAVVDHAQLGAGRNDVRRLPRQEGAHHQGGGIVIRIQDDGKGLDSERILAKAIERLGNFLSMV